MVYDGVIKNIEPDYVNNGRVLLYLELIGKLVDLYFSYSCLLKSHPTC